MAKHLPSGTVTFLFTDVEGSTRLLHDLGADHYAALLADHRRILREAVARHGGVEVDTQGDAFFVGFPTAPGAIATASEVTEALAGGPIRVRMGLHTGTPLVTDDGYIGPDVHRAARIAAAGHGGQVLVSAATAQLVTGAALRDLGEHRLKDLTARERIFQLGDGEFPPLKTLHQSNLPIPATPFVGREAEIAELVAILGRADARLVTLTGPGGTGKTRLALAAVAAVADAFPGGVWWVPLAPLRDAALVMPTAAGALGASGDLARHIGDTRLLLLLDNFEHLMEAAGVVADLIGACPNLTVVVTSRELLTVAGERAYPVPPLEPRDGEELFVSRAHAAMPSFEPNADVTELCARLENLPLALELAAARVRLLSPGQLLDRLGSRLDLLKAGRAADPRQQTLRATIEWSHDLLSPDEQRLFAGLAVFRGGCTLGAVEAVCDADLDTLQSLVDKSLVRVRDGERFWMLETIREYAADRLAGSGEADDMRQRHAQYYLQLTESANLSVDVFMRAPQHLELVVPEVHNLRAALDWAEDADVELGLRLLVASEQLNWGAMDPREGMRRYEAMLPRAEGVPRLLRARAMRDYSGMADLADELAVAERASSTARDLFRELGDQGGIATTTFRLGAVASARGELSEARRLWEESREIWRQADDPIGEIQVLGFLGGLEMRSGDVERGLEMVERSLEMARDTGWEMWVAWRLADLAEGELAAGRNDAGERRAREALALGRELELRPITAFGLSLLAWAASQRGELERAAVLWATVEAEHARSPIQRWDRHRARHRSHLPNDLPPAAALTLDEAVGLVTAARAD